MIMKEREVSDELKIYRSLSVRTELEIDEEKAYLYVEKGFEGEQKFDRLAEPVSGKVVFLNDLLLEHKKTLFQLDSVGVNAGKVYLFEVKNLEGDYLIEGEKWKSCSSKKEIKSPMLQLNRAESMLRQLLEAYGIHAPIVPYLVFVNPEFHLYNPPMDFPIVYPAQLNRFIDKLHKQTIHAKKSDIRTAEKLLSFHSEESPYSRVPAYRYEDLRKGIVCFGCGGFYGQFKRLTLLCENCGKKENCNDAVLRVIREFKLLFPEMKLSTNQVHDICKVVSKRAIRSILLKNFDLVGYGKHSYYEGSIIK
ncbi:nuclease-related domain-containing protein [Bacillus sp. AK031]